MTHNQQPRRIRSPLRGLLNDELCLMNMNKNPKEIIIAGGLSPWSRESSALAI